MWYVLICGVGKTIFQIIINKTIKFKNNYEI